MKLTRYSKLLRATCIAASVALNLIYWPTPGLGFTSCYDVLADSAVAEWLGGLYCGPLGHHIITIVGLQALPSNIPLPAEARERIANANEYVDLSEIEPLSGKNRKIRPQSGTYNASHHFDRPLNSLKTAPNADANGSAAAFQSGLNHINQEKSYVLVALKEGCHKTGEALDALGRALHALQDAYSHSNYVDELSSQHKADFDRALNTGTAGAIPINLKLTLYDFPSDGNTDPENPDGTCTSFDPTNYCHKYWSKDHPLKNDDYRQAHIAATLATTNFVQNVINSVGLETWGQTVGRYPDPTCKSPPSAPNSPPSPTTGLLPIQAAVSTPVSPSNLTVK